MSVSCNGDRSCSNSNVELNGGAVYVNGYLGAANSVLKISSS